MPTTSFAGSIFPSPGTVHIIGTLLSPATYITHFDLGGIRDGDELELRVANQVSQGGTPSLQYEAGYAHRQATQIKTTPPYVVTRQAMVNIKMVAGSSIPRWLPYETITL